MKIIVCILILFYFLRYTEKTLLNDDTKNIYLMASENVESRTCIFSLSPPT
jgi:hypothetical protein